MVSILHHTFYLTARCCNSAILMLAACWPLLFGYWPSSSLSRKAPSLCWPSSLAATITSCRFASDSYDPGPELECLKAVETLATMTRLFQSRLMDCKIKFGMAFLKRQWGKSSAYFKQSLAQVRPLICDEGRGTRLIALSFNLQRASSCTYMSISVPTHHTLEDREDWVWSTWRTWVT